MSDTQILYYCRAKSCSFYIVVAKRDRDQKTEIWKKNTLDLENHVKKEHENLIQGNPDWASVIGVFVSHGLVLEEGAIQRVLARKSVIEIW